MFNSCHRRPGALLPAVVLLASTCATLAASPSHEEKQPVDLAAIQPGRGVVFGSIELRWPHRPALSKGPGSNEKIIEIRRLDKIAAGEVRGRADATLVARIDQGKPFLFELDSGGYMVTCLYHKDVLMGAPTGYCYPVQVQFGVMEGEVTYIGHVAIDMPSKLTSLHLEVQVSDQRESALGALQPEFGGALAVATTRLAAVPGRPEGLGFSTEHFARLTDAMQRPDMVHSEEQRGAYTLTRFAVVGRSKDDWDIAFEIFNTPRPGEPDTPALWLEKFRGQSPANCQSEWKILEETAESVTFERSSPDCPPHAAQQALYRLLYGREQVFLLICTQKGILDEQTRAECAATLAGAAIGRR